MSGHPIPSIAAGSRIGVHRVRNAIVNYLTALTFNAAIVMSVPRSTSVIPAPMVLRTRRRLIDGTWHEGEWVAGERPAVVVVAWDGTHRDDAGQAVISIN